MVLNITKLRRDTIGCEHIVHFNNAGAALPPMIVTQTIKHHLDLESTMGGYEAALYANDKINQFYSSTARLINCQQQELAFTENATRAWDMAFHSLGLKKGDKILTATSEYASNYLDLLHQAKVTGIEIVFIKNDASGQLDVSDLESNIDKSVKLIAITHVPSNNGLVNPVIEVGKIAKQYAIPYLLDAAQSIGQMEVNVAQIGCDFLCATGRKYLRGPRGTGFLFVSTSILDQCEPIFIDLHSAQWLDPNNYVLCKTAQRFETWEQYIAGKMGLGAAIDYLLDQGIKLCWQRILYLSNLLRTKLSSILGVRLYDTGINRCGIITFGCEHQTPLDIQKALALHQINVSICLAEHARVDMQTRGLSALVRASVHYYNDENEIEKFCECIEAITKYAKRSV